MSAVGTIGPRISGAARKLPTWPVYLVGMVPGGFLIWAALTGGLGFDPVNKLELELGLLSLQFLLGSLLISPLLRFGRVNLIKFRKALGLLAFGYLVLHFLVWLLLDLQLRWGQIGADIVKRPYLTVGFAAFLMLVPLAATSWQGAIRRMSSQAWARLHRLVYPAAILGCVHFIMQEKVWTAESLAYLAAAILLVGSRLAWIRRW
ncbi:protein-methionine-sulfoxide reductase heme-binding subunit MsrQ [Jannaschia pohangensis]|uniref:Protein-methionine-sulfoxide reductase heme-binding subunit MsrQ n=1 Tax=Jannaschia pohangensis TaxID=390807 RepID=A0A1I3TZM9_9RHOB|nr:protein-methionine-sulfoxide reductase heme-binding subunit MsrQ [Jannaschia pohangensis]SFJ76185.1 sulfoxide reductase heme-binding subunit YedZ [Jannaschia pohangensis]